jgi:putative peptidoglycan lipid II flippase
MQATEREPLSAPAPEPVPAVSQSTDSQRGIARAATITSIGNLSSRIFGLILVTVKSFYFGNGQAASAFELAATVPTQFYDLLIGGMLSSALVPTFSGLADGDDRSKDLRAFGQLLGALISLATVLLSALVVALVIFAVPIGAFISGGSNQDPDVVASLLRLTIPAIIFLNLSGIVTGALFARRKFGTTAFTATLFNIVAIACMVLFQAQLGVMSLALGLLMGSLAQLLMQLPGLRGVPIKLSLNWRTPGVTKIVRLFLPVAGGLVFAQLAVTVSFILASQISAAGPATMRYAAQVIQFPLGMIVTAVSAAILPPLSSSSGDDFKATLAQGLRLVWVLIVPASVGLYVLATPVIALLFQHGAFTAESTAYTASALRAAVPGLLFAAIDTPLIYAFYAQRDTRTPTLIGLGSTAFYLVWVGVLSLLAQNGARPFTLDDLILANSLKTGVDAALMGFFLWRKIGGLNGFGIAPLALKVIGASAVMGGAVWGVMTALAARFDMNAFGGDFVVAVGSALIGAAVYAACAWLLRVQELAAIPAMLRRRVR